MLFKVPALARRDNASLSNHDLRQLKLSNFNISLVLHSIDSIIALHIWKMPLTKNDISAQARVSRARQYLSTGGIAREDSDDELGMEDHPWQWIYSHSPPATPQRNSNQSLDIIGAHMGDFECYIGDCVLLKAEGHGEAWVGLICEFVEGGGSDNEDSDDDDSGYGEGYGKSMSANFMWFGTEREIRNEKKRREDALSNEVYITPSWDVNPLASINGKATVLSQQSFLKRYPSGKIPRSSKDFGKTFVCRRGCNTRTATYTDEFVWENIYQGADDVAGLVERVKSQTKATRRKRKRAEECEGEDSAEVRSERKIRICMSLI